MKILIGDDNLTQRVMLDAVVGKWGFETVLAEDGRQAWDILSAPDAPRLVLLDWEMPGLDGIEVCRRVRENLEQDPPYILLLTARSDTADIVAGLEAGANDYIAKPFENTELRARLQVGKRMLELQRQLIDAREALEFQASHDALTGLLNRGAIMQAMELEIQRAQRNDEPLHVALMDIDHFKSINDNHGHLAGDAALREVAARISRVLRPYDKVGRYGGEEFLLLVNCDYDPAEALFQRLRGAVAESACSHEDRILRVTASVGFSQYRGQPGCGAAELLAAADAALYAAKAAGRDRVAFRDVDESDRGGQKSTA